MRTDDQETAAAALDDGPSAEVAALRVARDALSDTIVWLRSLHPARSRVERLQRLTEAHAAVVYTLAGQRTRRVCSQKDCLGLAAWNYSYPGAGEQWACDQHEATVRAISGAMGLGLALRPVST